MPFPGYLLPSLNPFQKTYFASSAERRGGNQFLSARFQPNNISIHRLGVSYVNMLNAIVNVMALVSGTTSGIT
jgi:hypothetical protein